MAMPSRTSNRAPALPKPALELAAILVGALIALAALHIGFSARDQRFEDFALGEATTSVYASVDGAPIHCQSVEDAAGCLSGHALRGARPVALWLGNSQVHAVNQLKPGEENAPPILFRRLAGRGLELITFSQPNANLQEHLVLFTYLAARLPVRQLVLSVVFDDLREVGIRAAIAPALQDPEVIARLERHEIGGKIIARSGKLAAGDLAALDQTVQEVSEKALTRWLEEHSTLWALRPQARGALFSNLYLLRNTLFGITAQSQRKMIPGRMAMNLAAGRALLADARERGISVLVYVVPLRGDVAAPYVETEYAHFKREIEALARSEGAAFANLESLVPAPLWGEKSSTNLEAGAELDFMHFQAGGHALLAEKLGELLDDARQGAAL